MQNQMAVELTSNTHGGTHSDRRPIWAFQLAVHQRKSNNAQRHSHRCGPKLWACCHAHHFARVQMVGTAVASPPTFSIVILQKRRRDGPSCSLFIVPVKNKCQGTHLESYCSCVVMVEGGRGGEGGWWCWWWWQHCMECLLLKKTEKTKAGHMPSKAISIHMCLQGYRNCT